MANYWSVQVFCAVLSTMLLAMGALDGGMECTDKDRLLTQISKDLDPPSECVLGCTVLTYRAMLETQNIPTVRFKDSTAGEHGEYCWSRRTKCSPGESLLHAYIVLPVDVSLVNEETLGLKATLPRHNSILTPHDGPTPLSKLCGLRFDITDQFTVTKRLPTFCVQVVPQQSTLENGIPIRCPPFLVTMWQRLNK